VRLEAEAEKGGAILMNELCREDEAEFGGGERVLKAFKTVGMEES